MNKIFCVIALTALFAVNAVLADNETTDSGKIEVVDDLSDDTTVIDKTEVVEDTAAGTGVINENVDSAAAVGATAPAVLTDDDDDDAIVLDIDEIEIIEDEDDAFEAFPRIVEFIDADYPQELRDEGIRGNVLLDLIVSETGAVDSVSVARPLHPVLDANAMDAARRFKFTPAKLKTGEYVAVMLQYEYRFHFEDVVTITEIDDTTGVGGDPQVDETGDTTGIAAVDNIDDIGEDDAHVLDDSFELTVYGREQSTEVAHHRLTIAEVKRIPGLGGEAVRVVQAMPGVARPSFGGNEVVVRGQPSWASRYFIDGVSVPLLYHLGGNTSSYPSEAVETVDFYPGGFSTRYGGAVGGVIEMKSRKSNSDSLRGYADLSMLDGALFIEGPINERVSFMASARRGFAGDLLALYFKHFDASGVSIAPYYWDYLLRTDIVINRDHELFVTFMGSWDSLGVFMPSMDVGSTEIDSELDQLNLRIDFHTLILGLDSRLSDEWTNALRFSWGYNGANIGMFGLARVKQTAYLGHLRNQASYAPSDNLKLNLGADLQLDILNMEIAMTTAQNMIVRDKIDVGVYGIIGAYANVEWKPADRLLLVPGVRYDYYPELDYRGSIVPALWDYGFTDNRRGGSGEPAFRVSGRYDVTEGHTAKAAIGTYSQSPEPYGMVIHEIYGEPDLPATKGAQYVAGYEWRISDLLSLDAQAYYNYMWDVPRGYDSRIDYDPDREIQRRFFHDGRGRTYGLELMLRHSRSEKFFGWASYTLSRSEGWSKIDDKFILSGNDQPHHLQLLGSWKLPKDWDFGTRLRFVSGNPTSPIIGTTEYENDKRIRAIRGERNSTRHDPFFQLDLRLDKKKRYSAWTLTYYADFQNVLWPIYKSPEFTRYNYNYTESQIIAMIPMISMGARAEF